MKLNPIHDRVVVRRVDADTQSTGGILIPDTASEKPDQGVVLAVGKGRRTQDGSLVPMTLNVNDRILFGKFAGQAVKIQGEEFLVLREEEVYAIIED